MKPLIILQAPDLAAFPVWTTDFSPTSKLFFSIIRPFSIICHETYTQSTSHKKYQSVLPWVSLRLLFKGVIQVRLTGDPSFTFWWPPRHHAPSCVFRKCKCKCIVFCFGGERGVHRQCMQNFNFIFSCGLISNTICGLENININVDIATCRF